MKNKIASIYFSNDKTYLTITENKENSVFLHYLNSTQDAINLHDVLSEKSSGAIFELFMMAADFVDDLSQLNVTLHPEYAYTTTLAGELDLSKNDIEKLLELEIRTGFENKKLTDFDVNIVEKSTNTSTNTDINNSIIIAELIPMEIIKAIGIALNDFGIELNNININYSMMSVASCFAFNYPEHNNTTNLLITVYEDTLEFLLISSNKILAYEFMTDFKEDISEAITKKINQIMVNTEISSFSNLYFSGSGLTKSTFLEFGDIAALFGADMKRLNPFRMLRTNFEQREREYCSRVFHLYVCCIGGAVPPYFNHKKLENFI